LREKKKERNLLPLIEAQEQLTTIRHWLL